MIIIRFFRWCLMAGLAASLAACLHTSSTSTVPNNPVAVPTELYNTNTTVSNEDDLKPTNATVTNTQDEDNNNDLLDQLTTIDQALNAGQYEAAQQQLAQLTPLLSSAADLKINLIILQTKLALLSGQPQQAMIWINQLPSDLTLNLIQQHYLMQLRSQALYRSNQILASAVANMQEAELTENPLSSTNNNIIWNDLMLLNIAELQANQANTAQPLIAGWLSLALIAQNTANHFDTLQKNILQWQQNYAQHPANALLLPLNANMPNQPQHNIPQSIAVILHLSGNYATLGEIVQNGLLTAYYASPVKSSQKIDFYDSAANSMQTIYTQIKTNQNDLILGPLTKEDTENLLDIAEAYPPIISLNYTSDTVSSTQLEFGLSPEDEARQIAQLAWRQGKSRAIIIAPQTTKGEETVNAFIKTWSNLGGQIVDQYDYTSRDDFSKSIGTLLGATDSRWRQHLIHTTLQLHIDSADYFRKDANMVFLVADAKTAQQIRPFLKFYSGNYLSVFATASVYDGAKNSNKNKDLNDVYFCDMPAILNNSQIANVIDKRLYFLGQDAYLLAIQTDHLTTYPHLPLMGTTGKLTVDPATHHIQRGLVCAQFKEGHPILLH